VRSLASYSLRARLLAITLALVTVGLVIAGAVTYNSLRTFLLDRVDTQLVDANLPAQHAIEEGPGFRPPPRGRGRGGDFGSLPQGIVAGFYDTDGVLRSELLGTDRPLPLDAGEGTYTADIAGAGEYRFIASGARLLNGDVAWQGRFVVGIPLGDVNSTLSRLLVIEFLVGMAVLGAIAGLGLWLVRLGLKPLTDIERTAGAIAAGDLSRRVEQADATTEVGRLGGALNTMLGTIEASFAERKESERRLRQFVADASHELQTPLTSVRGYAELFRRGAADRPEDLANAMHRIEAESQRMGLLVDDLLMLARLDQGRPMAREPVDLAKVTRELVGDARVVDPDRVIDVIGDDNVVITGDGQRLRQVLANLLSNARTHTPAGTPISVTLRLDEAAAVISVADRGPGMAAAHAARVFERFFRADPSRARASGGSGLGLSIVSAIVAAHGGTVTVDTTPGDGATFTVRLPVRPPAQVADESEGPR
jgi:two-component system, OmpR family, sensor kinase